MGTIYVKSSNEDNWSGSRFEDIVNVRLLIYNKEDSNQYYRFIYKFILK